MPEEKVEEKIEEPEAIKTNYTEKFKEEVEPLLLNVYEKQLKQIEALEEELYILYSENERNEALIESKEDELDELIEEQTIKSLEWVQKLKYKITLKKRAEEFISEIRNIIQYIDNEVENVENLIKYTSTDEVMQPPKEIIFYDETLETIMEKFDTSGCKVLPVLKDGVFLGAFKRIEV